MPIYKYGREGTYSPVFSNCSSGASAAQVWERHSRLRPRSSFLDRALSYSVTESLHEASSKPIWFIFINGLLKSKLNTCYDIFSINDVGFYWLSITIHILYLMFFVWPNDAANMRSIDKHKWVRRSLFWQIHLYILV